SPTYDATHLYPASALSPSQVASIRIGVFIETNDSPKYTGTVTAVDPAGASITVSGWFQMGNTGAGQVPAGSTAYVDVVTSPFAANFVVTYNGSYANGIGPTGLEIDSLQNTAFTLGNIFTTAGDSPVSNELQLVAAGSNTTGSAITINGSFARGILIRQAANGGFIYGPATGTGFLSGQTSGNGFEIRNPSSGITTAALTAPGDLNLGKQSGGSGANPHINLYSSANGVIDAQIWGAVGNTSALNGSLRVASGNFQVYGPSGTGGDNITMIAQPAGQGGVIAMGSPSANSSLALKSQG